MKRAICVLAALLLLMTAHAAAESATVDQPGGSATIDVKAVYRETADEYVYKEEVSGGEVSVTTDEGITVTVSGDEDVLEDGLSSFCGWYRGGRRGVRLVFRGIEGSRG